jgi:tetratricopeptide (TPR) repeat protein
METSPSTGTDGTEVRSPSAPVRARGLSWAAIGLVWGACVLLRPNALFLAIPLAWLAWRQRTGRSWRGLAHLAAFAVAMALVVIPITARNLVVTGEPVLLSANGGLNVHIGNRPGASGTFEVPPALAEAAADPDQQFAEFRQVAESDTGKELGPAATDLYWYERTWALIAQDPLGWLATLGEKLHLFFNGRELSNVYDYEFARKVNDVLAQPLVQLAWFAPLALLGTLLLLRRNDPRLRWIAGFNLTMALAVVVFFVVARYRLPAIGGFMLAATAAARELVSMARERRWRSAAATGLALLACAAFTYPVSVNKSFGDEYFKLGAKWHEQQLFHQAENAYQAAIRHNPDHLRSHHNLAVLYGGTLLDPEDARHHWKQVERIARERGNTKALEQARQGLRDGGQAL